MLPWKSSLQLMLWLTGLMRVTCKNTDRVCNPKSARWKLKGTHQSAGAAEVPPMTTSSLRLAKWLTEYAHLMKIIRSDAGRIWSAMAELFELYFLHTFHTFGDITIAALMSTQQHRQVICFLCKACSLVLPLMW